MSFEATYLAATQAFDAKQYVEAVRVYLELLKHEPDRIFHMVGKHEGARLTHYSIATQYAYQKLIIQRVMNETNVSLDLSPFLERLNIKLTYGPAIESLLNGWKAPSDSWMTSRDMLRDIRGNILKNHLPNIVAPDPIDADEYVAFWIVQDFLDFDQLLPETTETFVGLGSGCCLFDAAYLATLPGDSKGWSVEINPGSAEAVEELSELYDIEQFEYLRKWHGDIDTPAIIVSIRSCAFLYSVRAFDLLFTALPRGSRVFLDVAPRFKEETLSYFEHLGASAIKHARHNETFRQYEFSM